MDYVITYFADYVYIRRMYARTNISKEKAAKCNIQKGLMLRQF